MTLISSAYGKARVRTMRVHRDAEHHSVSELSTDVLLQGDFDRAYTHADNRMVIATDSLKNIINIVAYDNPSLSAEGFCEHLARHLLLTYGQVTRVTIRTREALWRRLVIDGAPHPHSFVLDGNGQATVHLEHDRDSATLRSGVIGHTFMKSTGSGWTDFLRDEFTTLADTSDRVAATAMDAAWLWQSPPPDAGHANRQVLDTMLEVFAATYSHGMQDSLYRMGTAALAAVSSITEIEISCPNKHYLPVDLSPFGRDATGRLFTPTDEPHGQIACTIRR